MITAPLSTVSAKLILRGIHLQLNDAAKASIETKAERLFRHEPRILRLRIEVERAHGGGTWLFTAKGHIEISGPDLKASVTTEDAYKSVNLLIDKLDRMLRKRTTALISRRYDDDIRAYVAHGAHEAALN
jgi:putative sigma-54 modulation protein